MSFVGTVRFSHRSLHIRMTGSASRSIYGGEASRRGASVQKVLPDSMGQTDQLSSINAGKTMRSVSRMR
ncbi:hypothetical protein RRG08_056968 [Elysia crispata]|uniref:Uncharacterized protein n=1 Tax=Elysia crispata TaxID=231223 RepID=A0AAE1DAK8_9GAST|nr:hypothetical protein RRG08_056968 [Elysia crispata]